MSARQTALAALALLVAACSDKSAYPQPSRFGSPTGASKDLVIGPAGGSLSSADGLLTLTVPAGAVAANTDFSITAISNTAPGGQGSAYRIGPDGVALLAPVTLTFQVGSIAIAIDQLTVAYQDGSAYWLRVPTSRDAVAKTIWTSSTHLSDWAVTTAGSSRDLFGPISYMSSIDIPFTASGNGILNYAGEDASEVYYLGSGSMTLSATSFNVGTATCTVAAPTVTQRTAVIEVIKNPLKFFYAMNGLWEMQCSDGTMKVLATTFDSEGISLFRCPRLNVGTPTITSSQVQGTVTIDCGTDGQVTGSWNFTPCTPGIACASSNGTCKTAAIVCTATGPVCTDTGNEPNGTTCGTNQVCNAGSCVACVAGDACGTQPDMPCHLGVHDCSTGTQQCINGAALANGTTCGTNMVCSGGVCSPCTAGLACSGQPDPLCHAGTSSCATGSSVCVNGTALANGTTCGSNQVCNGGACTTCASGDACTTQPDTLCHLGVHDCSTGTQQCINGAAVPNGTSCGSNMVCNGGVCTSCTAGQACTGQPDPLCHAGTTSCATGTSVCVNGTALANGTVCGTNMVCNAGVCSACTAGLSCTGQPDPLCHAGTTSCASGTSVCANGAALANGTACGSNQVCNAGACTTCASGDACTTQPDTLCHLGMHDCSTGTQQCINGAALANGTSCGTSQVCNAGSCVGCVAGDACTTQPDVLCHLGVHDCSTGTQQCIDGANRPDGTSCGTDQVCNSGSCVSCAAGGSCSTQPDTLCHVGVYDCSTGTQQCSNGPARPDGTSCGAGQGCSAGSCVPSITGTRQVTYWDDTGTSGPVAAPDVAVVPPSAPVLLRAFVANGAGGWTIYPGFWPSKGAFSIPGVPAGPYLLGFTDAAEVIHLIDTSNATPDLGYDVLGRSDATAASGSTPVAFDLTGLVPWAAGDGLQVTSSNAGVWDALSIGALTANATSGTVSEDWYSSNSGQGPLALLSPGDVLYAHQMISQTDATSGLTYLSSAAFASLGDVALIDKAPATLTMTLAATSAMGSLASATWNIFAFEALLPAMNPNATVDSRAHSLTVGASPFPTDATGPAERGSPVLLSLQAAQGTTPDPVLGTLGYGRFLDSLWSEWRAIDFTAHVSYSAPSSTPLDVTVSVGRREPIGSATPLSPTLAPVQSPAIGGANAFANLTGVTTTPVIGWSAPATGTPTSYLIEIYRLDAVGGASRSTLVVTWQTAATSVSFPPGILVAGATYYARITANAITADPFATGPFRRIGAAAYASTLTGTWSP